MILFVDAFAHYSDQTYLFFSTFSTYTFLMTALAYQLFVLDITYVTRSVRFVAGSYEATKMAKRDKSWKFLVKLLIVSCAVIFVIDYCI